MPLLVGEDAGGHIGHVGVAGPVAERPVTAQRHYFGQHQREQLQSKTAAAAHQDEDGVGPVPADRGRAGVAQHVRQPGRVPLLLGHEQPDRGQVDRVTGSCRRRDQAGPVAVLAGLESLDTTDQRPVEVSATGGMASSPPDARGWVPPKTWEAQATSGRRGGAEPVG